MTKFVAFLAVLLAAATAQAPANAQGPLEGRLKTIVETKTIKVAYRTDSRPMSFVGEMSQPAGFSIDVCKAVIASLEKQFNVPGLKTEWVPATSANRFELVATGKADMECGSSTITLGRLKMVDFSNAFFVETTGALVKVSSNISHGHGLAGKKVAVIAGTTNEQAFKEIKAHGQIDVTVVSVKDRAEGLAQLEAGTVDAFASDKLMLAASDLKNPQSYVVLEDDFSFEPYGIVLPRGDWTFRLAVNTGLAHLMRSGRIVGMFRGWFERAGVRPTPLLLATWQLGMLPD